MLYHPDPDAYIAGSCEYGAFGKALVELSNLEFAHDRFIFKFHETNLELSLRLSKDFPRHFTSKTNFLIGAIANTEILRRAPIFEDGSLDLLWLQYQLDELYEVRSIMAHGSIFHSERSSDRISWAFDRCVKKERKVWGWESVVMSNGYLATVHYTAEALRAYLNRLTRYLDGGSSWEGDYQIDKEIRENRKMFVELVEAGVVTDDSPWVNAFPPLGSTG